MCYYTLVLTWSWIYPVQVHIKNRMAESLGNSGVNIMILDNEETLLYKGTNKIIIYLG